MNIQVKLDEILSHQVFGISVFMYLGIFALFSLLLTAYLAKARKPKGSFMRWHHYMVLLSLFLALIHAVSGILVMRPIGAISNQYKAGNSVRKSPEIVAGQKIFIEICAGCHENGGNIITPNLPITGSSKLADYETFLSFIRDPKMPDGSIGAMRPFPESNLSNDEVKQLYNYLIYEYRISRSR
jgi:mono/diheme cytochrome c family protein